MVGKGQFSRGERHRPLQFTAALVRQAIALTTNGAKHIQIRALADIRPNTPEQDRQSRLFPVSFDDGSNPQTVRHEGTPFSSKANAPWLNTECSAWS